MHQLRRSTDLPLRAGHSLAVAHEAMVNGRPLSTEVESAEKTPSIALNFRRHNLTPETLQAIFAAALRAADLNDGDAAGLMEIGPTQFSRQIQGVDKNYLQYQKWAALPDDFWFAFVVKLGEALGCTVRQPDIADLTIRTIASLIQQFGVLVEQRGIDLRGREHVA